MLVQCCEALVVFKIVTYTYLEHIVLGNTFLELNLTSCHLGLY